MSTPRSSKIRLVLASASPRRKELLAMLGIPFDVLPSNIDEHRVPGESSEKFAERLAEEKAKAVAGEVGDAAVVIGADTVVAMPDGEVLGKPVDRRDAERMLRLLGGKEHLVQTGFCVTSGEHTLHVVRSVATRVRFGLMSEQDIATYIATNEPMDKAGAYGIQGYGGLFVRSITGSYSNVVGLPMAELHEVLRGTGLWPEYPFMHEGKS